MTLEKSASDAKTRLKVRLDALLEQSLGLSVVPNFRGEANPLKRMSLPLSPLRGAFAMGSVYLLAFVAVPWLVARLSGGDVDPSFQIMLLFQVYGAFWSGWATANTRATSSAVVSIIDVEVLPNLPDETATWVLGELNKREFSRGRLLLNSWAIGIVSGALAALLLHRDLPKLSEWMLIQWAAGWALLYTTSAKVVNVARFYEVFARGVSKAPACLYPLTPAKSPLIASLKALSTRMLLFWFGIMLSIAAIIPFNWIALKDGASPEKFADPLAFHGSVSLEVYSFVLAHLVLAALFSIGVGTIVFLQSEAALRQAIRKAVSAPLDSLQEYAAEVLSGTLSEAKIKELTELNKLYTDVSSGGSYQAMFIGGLSVLLPFVPIITLLLNALGKK